MTALPVTRVTVLRVHRPPRLLQLQALTGVHLTLVCHRPRLPAALHCGFSHTAPTSCST
jgi:hypothetical protein